MVGNGAVLAIVFASAHGSLSEDVSPLLRKRAFRGLDFALEGQQAGILISVHFGRQKNVLCSLRQKVEIYCT